MRHFLWRLDCVVGKRRESPIAVLALRKSKQHIDSVLNISVVLI